MHQKLRHVGHHVRAGAAQAHKHKRAILVWGLSAFFILGGLATLWAATLQIPDLASLQNRKVEQSIKIYDRTGSVLLYDLHNNQQRTIVPISQISPNISMPLSQ
jgi:membrane peptidoglycan carboxypeptidase